MSEHSDTRPLAPAPADLDVKIGGKLRKVTYEQAFGLAFELIDQKQYELAAQLFERLEHFTDRGPRAFIMHAFCEAAASHFESCTKPLSATFQGDSTSLAGELHSAFISYHVGIRNEAIAALTEIVNSSRELPTVCLLLGDMLQANGRTEIALNYWSLAIKCDWPNGSVAIVAARHMQLAKRLRSAS